MIETKFSEEQICAAKILEKSSLIYQKFFLEESMKNYRNIFKNGFEALIFFLTHFAYERAGSPKAYSIMAKRSVSEFYKMGKNWRIPTQRDAYDIWKKYRYLAQKEFNNMKLNDKTNPINVCTGVLTFMANESIDNLSIFFQNLLNDKKTKEAYKKLTSIRGIGVKIASFYLRDLAYLSKINEDTIADIYLLQPIDTWLEQVIKILFPKNPKCSIKEKQKKIVDLCVISNASSLAFNQGAWVLGSQIAGDFESLKNVILDSSEFQFKKRIKEHIEIKEIYLEILKKFMN